LMQMQAIQMAATASTATGTAVPATAITWSSLDERIATIDPHGLLLPRKPGTARIVARAGAAADTSMVGVGMRWLDVSLTPGSGGCGIGGDSTAYCWSDSVLIGSAASQRRPVEVLGGVRFSSIAAGSSASCGLTSSGEAYCWGENDVGQLGTIGGPASLKAIPVQSAGVRFTQLSSSADYTCGVATTGVVYCWGSNEYGQLGITDGRMLPTPTPVPGLPRATKVTTGLVSTCALITDGRVYCWGTNIWGQLGRANVSDGWLAAGPIVGDRTYRDVAISISGGCAIAVGDGAYCWGNYGTATVSEATPLLFPGTADFTSLVAGELNRCGLTPVGAKCWGSNFSGQLGIGSAMPGVGPMLVVNSANFVKLTFGGEAACALTSTGDVFCWGANYWGQLGDGTVTSRNTPTKLLDPIT
jgi:alpha-tubulin suppressor-like RCC1 family protein